MSDVLDWASRAVSAADVVSKIDSGARVFVHGAAATPIPLLDALADREDIEAVRLYHLHTMGAARFVAPDRASRIRSVSLFTGEPLRAPIAEGRADFIPVFLSDIPRLFAERTIPLDVALVQLSPPDEHGLCSLGTSIDAARSAVDSARLVLAEINLQMPRTLGATTVPFHRLDAFMVSDRPLPTPERAEEGPVEAAIGALVAALVPDGATLQMGIGGIPDAVLRRLGDKNDLGVHTEMFSDGLLPLLARGNVTNRRKKVHPGRTVTSFVMGSAELYRFVNDNPLVEFHPCDRTNDITLIRKNPDVVAINSALQIDLSGQICADSIGHRIYSGVGGQMDFMHAAGSGGVPIIALPSTAGGGRFSRIVPELAPGAGVVTTRAHVHWVVTEHGAVNLHGKTLRERGEALVSLAHPDFRGELIDALKGLKRA
jgi:4-hydroxybutyrate CoA-transferase